MPPRRQRPRESPALVAFGRQMRRMREAKGIKQETVAHLTKVSGPQVSRIEGGKKRATRSFVEIVDDYLEAGGALLNLWEDLNKDGHPVPLWFDWPQIEADAAMLVCWQHSVVPGLAQTPAYALAMLRGNQEAADARISRQAIVTKDDDSTSPTILLLLDEHVLHNQVGTPEVMREQLEHLIAIAGPRLSIQIVPQGMHSGLLGGFVIATLADGDDVLYAETAIRGITTSDAADVSAAIERFEAIRTEALPLNMSLELIKKTVEERWS